MGRSRGRRRRASNLEAGREGACLGGTAGRADGRASADPQRWHCLQITAETASQGRDRLIEEESQERDTRPRGSGLARVRRVSPAGRSETFYPLLCLAWEGGSERGSSRQQRVVGGRGTSKKLANRLSRDETRLFQLLSSVQRSQGLKVLWRRGQTSC